MLWLYQLKNFCLNVSQCNKKIHSPRPPQGGFTLFWNPVKRPALDMLVLFTGFFCSFLIKHLTVLILGQFDHSNQWNPA